MSAEERHHQPEPPPPVVFTNYRLVGAALREATVRQIVAASPYRGPSQEE